MLTTEKKQEPANRLYKRRHLCYNLCIPDNCLRVFVALKSVKQTLSVFYSGHIP